MDNWRAFRIRRFKKSPHDEKCRLLYSLTGWESSNYNISLPDTFSLEKLFKRINDFPIPENDKLKLLNSEARFLWTEEEWRFIEKNFSKEAIDSVYKTKPDFASMEQ